MLQKLNKLYFNNIHVIVTICVQELNTYWTVKNHMEILKLSQKHTSHKLLWRPIVLLKERKRGIVEWPVNRCPLRKVRIGRGKERRWNHKVALLFRSTQLPFPHRVIAFLCTYIYKYIYNIFVYKHAMYVQILNI